MDPHEEEELRIRYDEMRGGDGNKIDADRFGAFWAKRIMEDGPGDAMFGQAIMSIPNIESVGEDKVKQFRDDALAKIRDAARPLVDQVFAFFDQDGNGEMTFEEFQTVVLLLESENEDGEDQGLKALFDVLDKNNNGKFEVSEAAELIKTLAAIGGEVAHILLTIGSEFARGPTTEMMVQQAFGMLDADGDGMISQEELKAALEGPLNMMEAQAEAIMTAPEDQIPPQALAVVKYFKKMQDVTIPKIQERLAPMAEDGSLNKATYCSVMKEVGAEIMDDEDIFAQAKMMNPELEMLPAPAKELLETTINESKAKFLENSEELYGATFDMFATGDAMTAQQLDTALTLILPKSAEEKFNQIWNLVDTDGDGKITEDEMKSFINKFVDMVVSIGHFTISIYKTLGQSLVIKIATVCIEAKDPSGLNFQQMNEIAKEGPEYAQRILLKE